MNIFKALGYPLKERLSARKLLVAIGLAAIPVLGYFIIKGWEFEISVRVRHGANVLLPPWKNIKSKLMRGMIIRFIGACFNLPTYFLSALSIILWSNLILTFLLFLFSTPISGWFPLPFWELFKEGAGFRIFIFCCTIIYGFLGNAVYWSGYLRYIETRELSSFFDVFNNLILVLTTMADDIVMGIFVLTLSFILGFLGSLAGSALTLTGIGAILVPLLIPAIIMTIMSLVTGHLFGQMALNNFDDKTDTDKGF